MEILFCSDALNRYQADEAYHEELRIVDKLGIPYSLFNFDKLVDDGDNIKATKDVELKASRLAVYRGWMLSPKDYYKLFDALVMKNMWLINGPDQYMNCHWFPNSYDRIKDFTPKTNWLPKEKLDDLQSFEHIKSKLKEFGKSPIIIKDYVKSEKHFWKEACFCPDASDVEQVKQTIKKFKDLRDIEGGIVFKEFVDLEDAWIDPILRTHTAKEYRLFFLDRKIISCIKYWHTDYEDEKDLPPLDFFEDVGRKINSIFFSMDVAKKKSGEWVVIEVGDGQVSGLPSNCDIEEFYTRLKITVEDIEKPVPLVYTFDPNEGNKE